MCMIMDPFGQDVKKGCGYVQGAKDMLDPKGVNFFAGPSEHQFDFPSSYSKHGAAIDIDTLQAASAKAVATAYESDAALAAALRSGELKPKTKAPLDDPTTELHPSQGDSKAIYVKHFKNIPMADTEIVLPEKKNPGRTPLDWVKFLVSAVIGLVTMITQLTKAKANIIVLATIGCAVIGYCAKTYFTFDTDLKEYQNLITRTMYDKQLDS